MIYSFVHRFFDKKPKYSILTYHSVERTDEQDLSYVIIKTMFEVQMQYLWENNFKVITMDQLIELRANNGIIPFRSVIITFDDGYEDNYLKAYPILKKYSLRATIFVITSLVGTPGYLNWRQIKEMAKNGMDIQSHTHTHATLTELDERAIKTELMVSKNIIESNLSKKVEILSLPGGVNDKKVKQIARELGFRAVCTSASGGNDIYTDFFSLRRLPIRRWDKKERFISFVNVERGIIVKQKMEQLFVTIFKRIFGLDFYTTVRNWLLREKIFY